MKKHLPVLADQAVSFLNPQDGKTYLDCTLGFGGHAQKIRQRNPKIKIIGIEQDPEAFSESRNITGVEAIYGNFKDLIKLVSQKVDGALFDLGVSSFQLDSAGRGFSYRFDSPLDMRMDKSSPKTAADIIAQSSEEELALIFKNFGEERFAWRIARRVKEKIPRTTFELREIVERAIPGWRKRESASRIFQSLRIAVNDELENLKLGLPQAVQLLNPGGRLVVISYHSLEDRIVKGFFKEQSKSGILKILTKKPIQPGEDEMEKNPRSRSAKLRAAEKI